MKSSFKREDINWDNVFKISKKITECIYFINRSLIGREEVINQTFYAILTG